MSPASQSTAALPEAAVRSGWLYGFIGVLIFSGSLPATRIAVLQLDPLFVTFVRAAAAGLLGLGLLIAMSERRPSRTDLGGLLVVAAGVVVGFPLFSAIALRHITSARGLVYLGLLPLSTAVFGVLRARERPKPALWVFALVGAGIEVGYALAHGAGGSSSLGDALMLAAIIAAGLGYAEGAHLSRRMGGWQVISWALVLSLPVMIPLAVVCSPPGWLNSDGRTLMALAYVSLFSMLIGFIFWYRGLALGGIAAVGQLQLVQPFLGFIWSAWLLREHIEPALLVVCAAVLLCVAGARRFAR
jgi:drug/metabolite transporter (DMT)-like permease